MSNLLGPTALTAGQSFMGANTTPQSTANILAGIGQQPSTGGAISTIGGGAATGAMFGGPVGAGVGAGLGLLQFGVSTYFNQKAKSKQLRILRKEQARQEALQKQQFQFQQSQASFNKRMARENLALSQEAQQFGMDQTLRANQNEKFDRFMKSIVDRMNLDQAFRQKMAKRGYI